MLVILDEFPYATEAEPGLPSILQNVWDHHLKSTGVFLALVGSHVGMMEHEISNYQAPLYGRATGRLLLHPLKFSAVRQFLPRYSLAQQVEMYAILGGIPSYPELWDDSRSVMKNIEEQILSPTSLFQLDPPYLLSDEVGQPRNYAAILLAIAAGHHTPTAIARVPVTERRPEASRRGRYTIADPYLRFYFRFLAPNLELIEQGRPHLILDEIEASLPAFVGRTAFEDLCRAWALAKGDAGELPFVPRRVGRWWDAQVEIDVAAVNFQDRAILLGEAKWTSRPVGPDMLDGLLAKAGRVVPGPDWAVHYAVFSHSGFTEELQGQAEGRAVLLVDLNAVVSP